MLQTRDSSSARGPSCPQEPDQWPEMTYMRYGLLTVGPRPYPLSTGSKHERGVNGWTANLILSADQPSMVVFDEMPYLAREDPGFEGILQKSFDRTLSRLPVLLVLIGSDLAMMEALNTYGRPFYQRGTEMIVPPLNPAEVASMLGVGPAEAIDAFLLTGASLSSSTNGPRGQLSGNTWNPRRTGPPRPSSSAASGPSRPSSPPRHKPGPCLARSGTVDLRPLNGPQGVVEVPC